MEQDKNVIEKLKEKAKDKKQSVLILLGISSLLVVLAFLSSMWFGIQSIKTIKISGNSVLTAGEVNAIIDKKIMNVKNDGLNLDEIKETLKANEFILDANVYINSRGVLGIQIEERNPLAIILDSNGNTMLIDQFGEVFSWRLHKEFNDFPIISNIFSIKENKIDKVVLQGSIEIIKEIANYHPQLYSILSEVSYNSSNNTYSLYLTEAGICVNLGKLDNLPNKFDNLLIFWKKNILQSNEKSKYSKLDARWKDCIISKNKDS